MDFPRLPRFERSATVGHIQLTERDRQIIRLVARHRFLRSSHITALLGGSAQQLLRRLQLLYHHGFLERPRAQLDYYYKGGSRVMVYGLGNEAVSVLRDSPGLACDRVRLSEESRSVGREYMEHALLVSDIMVTLELACRQTAQARLIYEDELVFPTDIRECEPPSRWQVKLENGLRLGVVPDRIFAIEFPDRNGAMAKTLFFLEADRGTMPIVRDGLARSSFYRKLLAYEATWTQEIHRAQFGFNRFRVITVTTGAKRLKSMLDACSQLKRGQGLFLFADKTMLASPANPLSVVWQTGRAGETATLLD